MLNCHIKVFKLSFSRYSNFKKGFFLSFVNKLYLCCQHSSTNLSFLFLDSIILSRYTLHKDKYDIICILSWLLETYFQYLICFWNPWKNLNFLIICIKLRLKYLKQLPRYIYSTFDSPFVKLCLTFTKKEDNTVYLVNNFEMGFWKGRKTFVEELKYKSWKLSE